MAEYQKVCGHCRAAFVAARCSTRFCSRTCRLTHYYAHNPEVRKNDRVRSAQWYADNKEKALARDAIYRAANREAVKQRVARWHAENRERVRANQARYCAKNPEKVREAVARWQAKNRERLKLKNAQWRADNPEKVREYKANYRARNPNSAEKDSDRRRERNLSGGPLFAAVQIQKSLSSLSTETPHDQP